MRCISQALSPSSTRVIVHEMRGGVKTRQTESDRKLSPVQCNGLPSHACVTLALQDTLHGCVMYGAVHAGSCKPLMREEMRICTIIESSPRR